MYNILDWLFAGNGHYHYQTRMEDQCHFAQHALLPHKVEDNLPVTSSDKNQNDKLPWRNKRAISLLAIVQGTTAIGGMLIKGINALVDAKRETSFNNAIKMLNANVEITHIRLVTLENRTSMMAKAIMPALKKKTLSHRSITVMHD